MKNNSLVDILSSSNFIAFVNACKLFCVLIERERFENEKVYLTELQKVLAEIYYLGFLLQNVSLDLNEDFENLLSEKEIDIVKTNLYRKIPFSYYWGVLNETNINEKPKYGTWDFGDDLMDIYKDLKKCLLFLEIDNLAAKEHAAWSFYFLFNNHTGEHCVDCLSVIHHYLSDNN